MGERNINGISPHNTHKSGISTNSENNQFYLPADKNMKCPYCGEKYAYGQKTYSIIKVRAGTKEYDKPEVLVKTLKPGCSWNCTRKEIDRLNSLRTEEDLKKGIVYKRG